jgi:hypothetical protein
MQRKKVPEYIRKRLVECEINPHTNLPRVPRKVLVRPLEPPSLPLNKIINVSIKAMDLDEDDKIELVSNLQIKHSEAEASKLAEHQAAELQRQAAHDQAEVERKNLHFQRLGEEYVA